jgi:hypothetical protein
VNRIEVRRAVKDEPGIDAVATEISAASTLRPPHRVSRQSSEDALEELKVLARVVGVVSSDVVLSDLDEIAIGSLRDRVRVHRVILGLRWRVS